MRPRRWQTALFAVLAASGCARSAMTLEDETLERESWPVEAGADGPDAATRAPPDGEGDEPRADEPDQPDGPHNPDPPDEPDDPDQPEADPPDAGPAQPADDSGLPASGECKAGTYVGTFSGRITALFVVNIDIKGDISIDALSAGGGDVLTIDHGKITGTDTEGNPVTADVTGTLDCKTKQLMNGALSNGVYVRKLINQTVKFQGTAQAVYAPGDPPTVNGVWQTSGGIEMGSGTFTAKLKP
jgi:hypothetical protein